MKDYNDGKWHVWNGIECPVHPKSEVEMVWPSILYPDKANRQTRLANTFDWKAYGDDVPCLFRVTKEHREPREFWLQFRVNGTFPSVHVSPVGHDCDGGFVIHVREVIE